MCLELSYASRTSVINRNCAELSNIFLLPGDKRLAGCLLVWKPQGECREKYLLKSSFSLSRGKKKAFKKKAFVASVICSTEIVQAEFSLFAVFPWKCCNCWVFKITVFRYFCSHNMRVKLTKECVQDNQPQLFVKCLIKCHFQLFITL